MTIQKVIIEELRERLQTEHNIRIRNNYHGIYVIKNGRLIGKIYFAEQSLFLIVMKSNGQFLEFDLSDPTVDFIKEILLFIGISNEEIRC